MTSARRARRTRSVALDSALWLAVVLLIGMPFYLALVTASKTGEQAKLVSLDLPQPFVLWENLTRVVTDGNGVGGLLNSVFITVPAIVLTLLFGAMAAWVFARGKTRSVQALYYLAVAGILLPPSIITTIRVLQATGLYGGPVGLILFYCGAYMGIAIFLMTGFVKAIPYSLEEAAQLDGAGTLRVFWHIIVPSLRPVLLTSGVFLALGIWNDFFYAYFLLPDPANATLPLGLFNFASANQYELNWNLIFAHAVFTSLPLLILFMFAQRRIISGFLGGGVK